MVSWAMHCRQCMLHNCQCLEASVSTGPVAIQHDSNDMHAHLYSQLPGGGEDQGIDGSHPFGPIQQPLQDGQCKGCSRRGILQLLVLTGCKGKESRSNMAIVVASWQSLEDRASINKQGKI